jgi:hypothetical protein
VQSGGQVPDGVTNGVVTTALGVPGGGYAQPGITAAPAALTTTGNGSPGAPNPLPGNVTDILANPGYGDVSPGIITPGSSLAPSLVPVPASDTVFTNPVGLACMVGIAGGTVTEIKVNGVHVGTGDGTYTVPAGGTITLTYSDAPTWTWATV